MTKVQVLLVGFLVIILSSCFYEEQTTSHSTTVTRGFVEEDEDDVEIEENGLTCEKAYLIDRYGKKTTSNRVLYNELASIQFDDVKGFSTNGDVKGEEFYLFQNENGDTVGFVDYGHYEPQILTRDKEGKLYFAISFVCGKPLEHGKKYSVKVGCREYGTDKSVEVSTTFKVDQNDAVKIKEEGLTLNGVSLFDEHKKKGYFNDYALEKGSKCWIDFDNLEGLEVEDNLVFLEAEMQLFDPEKDEVVLYTENLFKDVPNGTPIENVNPFFGLFFKVPENYESSKMDVDLILRDQKNPKNSVKVSTTVDVLTSSEF